jgi:hypothetical protein
MEKYKSKIENGKVNFEKVLLEEGVGKAGKYKLSFNHDKEVIQKIEMEFMFSDGK